MAGTGKLKAKQDYQTLRRELLSAGALFADPYFPPNTRSLTFSGQVPAGLGGTSIVWKRPHDMVADPQFIVNKAHRHDIDQGLLGNCWFIAGVSVLVNSHKQQFERIVSVSQSFEAGNYTGMFRFQFWWYGKWKEVVVDDYLPTDGYRLIYCRNKESPNEFWASLMEKAYAKLRGNYEALDGGKMQDTMVDLTGGISEVIDIRQKNEVSPELYSLLYTSHKMKTLMGACIFHPENSPMREIEKANGLYMGHAYSITGFRQIPTGRGTVNLLRLRNPWGRGEWKGSWSDKSLEMTYLSEQLKKDLMFQDKDEGEFWISYEDFLFNFDEIQLCHLQPDAYLAELADNDRKEMWNVTVYHDAWLRGVTAGGCGNTPYESLYWKNPQFYITLSSPDSVLGHGHDCTLIVSLMEKENDNKSKIAIGFDIYKLKSPELRPLDNSRAPRNALLLTQRSGSYVFYREVTKRFELKPGTYVVIPSTFNPHEEAQFMLRLFTEKHVESGVLDEKVAVTSPLPSPRTRDGVEAVFERHAGPDKKLEASELCLFLEEISTVELGETLKFSLESCRSLVALLSENKAGFLSGTDTKRAWKQIKAYKELFKHFDVNNSNTVDSHELGTLFSRLGFPISRAVLASIVRRYGGRDNSISLSDFVMVLCKLTSLVASFNQQQKMRGQGGDMVEFTRNEFLEMIMFV